MMLTNLNQEYIKGKILMQDNKNFILAVVLSMMVLISWHYFYERPRLEQLQRAKAIQAEHYNKNSEKPEIFKDKSKELLTRDQAITNDPRVKFNNGTVIGSISLRGLRIDDLRLQKYYTDLENRKDVVLLSPSDSSTAYFAEFGFISSNPDIKLPNADSIWKANKSSMNKGETLTASWDNGQGLVFEVDLSLDDNYLFSYQQRVVNNTNNYVSVIPYGLINRIYRFDHQSYMILHEGPLGVFDSKLHETTYKDLESNSKQSFKKIENAWVGITDKYWFSAFIPEKNNNYNINFTYSNLNNIEKFQVDFLGDRISVAPNDRASFDGKLFAGAKELEVLDKYSDQYDIELFDRALDFGWFYFLTKPLFILLKAFNSVLGNFGLAIIAVTILIKLLLLPTASKSFKSMNAMKKLQPEIKALQERYKDDKMQFNQKIMELYKKEKVNPLAGCLPLIIQIPVLFSLYKVLFVTIEMRHAPFFGWIKDLSAPDPTTIFNLFGLIPWDPPQMLMIGIWPIIMAISMFIQQSLGPEPSDPIQAKMMKFLPLIFVFLFASFPAGLVIYWAVNNILSIFQQLYLKKNSATQEKLNEKYAK